MIAGRGDCRTLSGADVISAASARRVAVFQLGLYFIVGGICFFIDVGGFVALRLSKLSVLSASVLSFVTATIVNYLLCCSFVFREWPLLAPGRDRSPLRNCACRSRPQYSCGVAPN
jgi:hypothetical protein